MLPKNWGEPMGAPAIFEKQIEIKLLPPGLSTNDYPFKPSNRGATGYSRYSGACTQPDARYSRH
ncbi:MAG: hypothetical protein P8X79_15200 [Reinekea sp.]